MKPLATSLAVALVVLATSLGGCATGPTSKADAGPPKSELQFVDMPGFDKSLTGSLGAALPKVDVGFYDRITPSALPDRLQTWLAAVEEGGGKVKVTPPKPVAGTRSPLLIVSALTSLWSASKIAREMAAREQFKTAGAYDAEILLKLDDKGQTVVDKVVFSQRAR
jgi:hypothetical protein